MSNLSLKVLLIEDNPINLELATDLLEGSGFEVITAQDAEVGVNLARETQPSLILMDLSLPGMDGLEATRALKADPQTAAIPVVAVTAHAMKGDEQKALDAGCEGYITKPIDTRMFPTLVMQFLERAVQRNKPQ
ncbi:MAG TPA: response regulator [Candidatus Binatia bacterium]|nr:response regulator [Candidatus Binatia bacterium]